MMDSGEAGHPTGQEGEQGQTRTNLAEFAMAARGNWRKLFAVRKFLSLAKNQSKRSPAELVICSRYRVGKKIANGAFGQLRVAKDVQASSDGKDGLVAVKMEPTNARMPMLFLEYRFYKALRVGGYSSNGAGAYTLGTVGFPKVFYFGTCGKYNALVMDLLGPNLEELFNQQGRQFSLKTILLIAIQMLKRVEHIHSCHLVYRDMKPENCLIGRSSQRSSVLHMVDFGLAKPYIDLETGRHIPYSENRNLTGTIRYMSVNAHQGKEQSRRDDLLSLGYVLYYFLTGGKLPWQGVRCDNVRKRYEIIGHIKEEIKISVLGANHPWEFIVFMRYCKSLKFSQAPDYSYLQSLFRGCLDKHNHQDDGIFDWNMSLSDQAKGNSSRTLLTPPPVWKSQNAAQQTPWPLQQQVSTMVPEVEDPLLESPHQGLEAAQPLMHPEKQDGFQWEAGPGRTSSGGGAQQMVQVMPKEDHRGIEDSFKQRRFLGKKMLTLEETLGERRSTYRDILEDDLDLVSERHCRSLPTIALSRDRKNSNDLTTGEPKDSGCDPHKANKVKADNNDDDQKPSRKSSIVSHDRSKDSCTFSSPRVAMETKDDCALVQPSRRRTPSDLRRALSKKAIVIPKLRINSNDHLDMSPLHTEGTMAHTFRSPSKSPKTVPENRPEVKAPMQIPVPKASELQARCMDSILEESKGPVASDSALLRAPLYKSSASDKGPLGGVNMRHPVVRGATNQQENVDIVDFNGCCCMLKLFHRVSTR